MTIWVGTTTEDLDVYGGGIEKFSCHMPLLKYNGNRWRYRDGSIVWYIEPNEKQRFVTQSWLEEKGQVVKHQFVATNVKQLMWYHGKDDAQQFEIR